MGKNDNFTVNVDNVHTILGAESTFEGHLTFQGTIRIDGNFKGEIVTKDVLVIGQGAKVEAEIKVGAVVINGTVRGNIVAENSVEVHAPGRIYGNITTPVLTIDRGVIFEGQCVMEKRPENGGNTKEAEKK